MVETKLHRPGLHVIGCLHTSDIFDDDRLMDLIKCFILRFGSTCIHGHLRGPPLPNDTPPQEMRPLFCKVLWAPSLSRKTTPQFISQPPTIQSVSVAELGTIVLQDFPTGNTWTKISRYTPGFQGEIVKLKSCVYKYICTLSETNIATENGGVQ